MTKEEALKIVRKKYCFQKKSSMCEALKTLIPELRESEDEKFRKYILQVCKECVKANDSVLELSMSTTKKLLAYLEKQKEHQELPLMNGDADLYFDNWIQHNDITKRGCFEEGMRYAQRLQKEQKPAEWDEEDEKNRRPLNTNEIKVGDIITYFKDGKKGIMLVSSFDSGIYPRCKWGITDIDGSAYGDWAPGVGTYYIATEKEKQQLYDTMPIKIKNWFNSLRSAWKPSEEQMEALLWATQCPSAVNHKSLTELYNDLKKLM